MIAPADILDVTAARAALPPAVYQAAWIAAKQARGQAVRMDRLQPSYVTGPATYRPCDTVAMIDTIRDRSRARIRARIAEVMGGDDGGTAA